MSIGVSHLKRELLQTIQQFGSREVIENMKKDGFKYGLGHPNPTEDILARYRELDGEIVTVGADAHAPEHVAFAFEKVPAILKNAGFSYFTVFRNRKADFIKLD